MWVVIGLLALAAAVGWFAGRGARHAPRDDDIDRDELERAERDVRDLDASVTPDEADEHFSDWGPGAPRT